MCRLGFSTGRFSAAREKKTEVMDSTTIASIPLFVDAFNEPFWQAKNGEEPDEDSSEAEVFLLTKMCKTAGNLDKEQIMKLMKEEKNHPSVMGGLACLLGYDIDMRDVEAFLKNEEEIEQFRRFVDLLGEIEKGI